MKRISEIKRKTNETDIEILLDLDFEDENTSISTGIGFFDHMLNLFSKHGGFGLKVAARGDIQVDCHHTVEDVGIVLGCALREALGDRKGIVRYGHSILPMDDALVLVAIDLGGRPYTSFDITFSGEKAGDLDTQAVSEFFRAVALNGGLNIHIRMLAGNNDHHIIEAVFKAFARALAQAVKISPDIKGVLSTKGVL